MTDSSALEIDFDARLLELAREQRYVAYANAVLQADRTALYAEHIQSLDDLMAANTKRLEEMEAALKADALAHALATGELRMHEKITFRRTTKLVYEKDEVLAELKREGELGYIHVREELDVRAFEKAWRAGDLRWTNAEEVPNPTVAIARLGDLLILNGEGDEGSTD